MTQAPRCARAETSRIAPPAFRGMLPNKRAVCINYGIVQERDKQHAANMESTFPAIFFAAIIGVVVFIAVSQVLLDSHE